MHFEYRPELLTRSTPPAMENLAETGSVNQIETEAENSASVEDYYTQANTGGVTGIASI